MSTLPMAPPPPPNTQYWLPPSATLRSPVGLSRAVTVLLGVVVATDVFAVWAGLRSLDVINRLSGPEALAVTDDEIDRTDALYALAGGMQFVAMLTTAVVFLVWFHRTRVNAEIFAPEYHTKRRGWTVWGWLCPVVNLWFPRRIALDIWNASSDGNRGGTTLLNWWWTLWLCTSLGGWSASRVYARAETPEAIERALGAVLFTDTLDLVAAILAICFVRRLTTMQHQKALRGPVTPFYVPNSPAL